MLQLNAKNVPVGHAGHSAERSYVHLRPRKTPSSSKKFGFCVYYVHNFANHQTAPGVISFHISLIQKNYWVIFIYNFANHQTAPGVISFHNSLIRKYDWVTLVFVCIMFITLQIIKLPRALYLFILVWYESMIELPLFLMCTYYFYNFVNYQTAPGVITFHIRLIQKCYWIIFIYNFANRQTAPEFMFFFGLIQKHDWVTLVFVCIMFITLQIIKLPLALYLFILVWLTLIKNMIELPWFLCVLCL